MRVTLAGSLVLFLLTGAAQADPCADLVSSARAALSMEGLDQQTRDQLEDLLHAGQTGDPARCEQATGSIFQSSPEGERAPVIHRCNESEKSV